MTTIVYHRGVFAYDSRITSGGTIITDSANKRSVQGGHVFYMAGSTPDMEKFRDAYLNGTNHGDLEVSAFVVGPDKVPYKAATNEDGTVWRSELEYDEPYAIGSGAHHVVTAIDCGKSPAEAVRMAIKRDACSGGKVRTSKL